MRRRPAAVAARAMRVVRGLWPDRNPLRRRLDRVEGVSPALASELCHLTNWPAGPRGLDELRVESVSLLGWAGDLVLAMLGQLEAAQLRQQAAAKQRTLLPSPPAAAGPIAAGGTMSQPRSSRNFARRWP